MAGYERIYQQVLAGVGTAGIPYQSAYLKTILETAGVDPRHSGGTNLTYLDGHAKWMKVETFYAKVDVPKYSPIKGPKNAKVTVVFEHDGHWTARPTSSSPGARARKDEGKAGPDADPSAGVVRGTDREAARVTAVVAHRSRRK